MAETEEKPIDETITPLQVLVIGTNQCWGMDDTLKGAMANACQPKAYNVFIVHPKTTIHEVTGEMSYPLGWRPKLIHTKGKVK